MNTIILDSQFFQREPEQAQLLLRESEAMLRGLSGFYPGFENWLSQKVRPGLVDGTRSLIISYGYNAIDGIAIVKDSKTEQKLCCLRVREDLQGSGLGIKLFKKSFEVLRNSSPLLSVSEDNYQSFEKIFHYFGFEFVKAYDEIYLPKKRELSFNGLLVPDYHTDIATPSISKSLQASNYFV